MENIIKRLIILLSEGVEITTALLIGYAVTEATFKILKVYLGSLVSKRINPMDAKDSIRLDLGKWLALSLEFSLAADILATVADPDFDDIAKLSAIALIRTGLNYFLNKEIKELKENQGQGDLH